MVPSDLNEKIMLTKSQVGFCSGNVSFFFFYNSTTQKMAKVPRSKPIKLIKKIEIS